MRTRRRRALQCRCCWARNISRGPPYGISGNSSKSWVSSPVTEKIGVVCGYAALFGQVSLNLAGKGEAPCFEVISPGSLALAPNLLLDRHHLEFLPVASTSSGTLRCGFDETG